MILSAARNFALKWRCFSCHVTHEVAPRFGAGQALPAILERSGIRITDAAYTGFATTPEEYIIESIIDPSVYIIEGDWYEMDDIYDEELSEEDLADIIAWMLTVE